MDKILDVVRKETQEILSKYATFSSQIKMELKEHDSSIDKIVSTQDHSSHLCSQFDDHDHNQDDLSCCDVSDDKETTIPKKNEEVNDPGTDEITDSSESQLCEAESKTEDEEISTLVGNAPTVPEKASNHLEVGSLLDVSLDLGRDLRIKSTDSTMKARNAVNKIRAVSTESTEESTDVIYVSYSGFKKKQQQLDDGQLIAFVSESSSVGDADDDEEDDCLVFLCQRDISVD